MTNRICVQELGQQSVQALVRQTLALVNKGHQDVGHEEFDLLCEVGSNHSEEGPEDIYH